MKLEELNFKHLFYFYTVAKTGSIVTASNKLNLSAQAISTQLSTFEENLGFALFVKNGRGIKLSNFGEKIFNISQNMFEQANLICKSIDNDQPNRNKLKVGLTDTIYKIDAYEILKISIEPEHNYSLECFEGSFDDLLINLSLQKIDFILSDQAINEHNNLKLESTLLCKNQLALYCHQDIYQENLKFLNIKDFNKINFLLPVKNLPLGTNLDNWFEQNNFYPSIIGEFADSALLKTFAFNKAGVFASSISNQNSLLNQYNIHLLQIIPSIFETIYITTIKRKLQLPIIQKIIDAHKS